MKKKRERLFKDRDILIPIENSTGDKNLSFWAHRSEYKKKKKDIVATIVPKKTFIKPKDSENESLVVLKKCSHKNIQQYEINNAEYVKTINKKQVIELVFKRKKHPAEKILANLIYLLDNILHAPGDIHDALKKGSPIRAFAEMIKERKHERLSALGSFWSTPLGTFIFRSSANAVGFLLILPVLILNRRFYMTDIPNVERLGHAVANNDILQAEFAQGMYKTKGEERTLLIFYPQISEIEDSGYVYFNKISFVRQISKSLSCKNIHILYLHPWIEKVLKRVLLKTGSSFFSPKPYGHRDIFNLLSKRPPLFSLTGNDEKYCIKFFEEKNFKLDRPLILCSNRSSGNINFNKSDCRTLSEDKRYGYRNSSFSTLIPTIQDLLGKGYNVIKVGSQSGSNEISSDRYFDFSAQPKSDKNFLLDLFLFSRCLFFIGDTSGNYSLAQAFRKPICFFNFVPFGHFHSWGKNSISIFKNIKNNKTGKLQKFSQILKYQYGYEIHNDKSNRSRKYISNTKKEILETVKEMEARISGRLYKTDESLQRRFRELFKQSYLHQTVNARCGDYFLKKYEYLL